MRGIQDTSTRSFRDLLGNGSKYIIPKFQRDYSWNTEQWDDLWQDLLYTLSNEESHYMGYLVLQSKDDKDFNIIDGQQRITTISILILTAIKCLKNLGDIERHDELVKRYIGVIDPVSLSTNNKLILNRNNNDFYKDYLVKLEELRPRGLKATEKLMKNCFNYYSPKVSERYKTGEEIAGFVENLVDKFYFTVIKVGDDLNAFKVFETLNARGVQLSSSDLLKNYLFSLIETNSDQTVLINELEKKWSELLGRLGKEKLPEFIRHYHNSKNKIVRKKNLFKTIKNNITTQNETFSFVEKLLEFSDIFTALKNPTDELWQEYDNVNKIKKLLNILSVFNLKQAFPLLMIAYKTLAIQEFEKVLSHIITISFRYSIIGNKNPNDLEKTYNNCAIQIHTNKEYSQKLLSNVYVSDQEFKNSFANKEISYTSSKQKKILRYIFSKIEKQEGGHSIDIEDENNTIEHILPQNPNENWDWDWDENTLETSINKLGNMTLLEKKLNDKIGNKTYTEKLEVFEKSSFKTTKKIKDSYKTEWTKNTISSRQNQLAKLAISIWSIQF